MKNPNQPIEPATIYKVEGESITTETLTGLTKREYFAGLMLKELISTKAHGSTDAYIVQKALSITDTLLKMLTDKDDYSGYSQPTVEIREY